MKSKLSRYCEGVIEATWLSAVIIIPIYFNINSSRIFEPDKVAILRSLALLALCAWLVKVIDDGGIQWTTVRDRSFWIQSIWKTPLLSPAIGIVLVYLIATIFSISPSISLWGSYQRLQGTYTTFSYFVFFIVIITNLRRWSQVERIITTIIVASMPVTLYGLLQRFGLDPIPWAGNTIDRIAANMGNSIFLAAYLIMVVPLTIGRLVRVLTKMLTNEVRGGIYIIQTITYIFILTLQLIAIYMSQSRGPMIGLLAGGYLMTLLMTFFSSKRWIRIAVIGLAIFGGSLLLSFNLENGPLENFSSIPGLGRYSMLLDPESDTALSRKYIWQGAVNMVSIHPPVKFPDGKTDSFNLLRSLIGYGPESMYVAYNQFYPPELSHIEKRNASPDRSHNETWDSLVTTGIFGLAMYLVIFIVVFYKGLKWLGFIRKKRDTYLLVSLIAMTGICGAIGISLWRGVEYLGIGLPFGILVGLLLYITLIGISPRTVQLHFNNFKATQLLIVLFSAILAYFVEINFGIPIVSTRMLFWIYAGLMVVVGHVFPMIGDDTANDHISQNGIEARDNRDSRRISHERRRRIPQSLKNSLRKPLGMQEMLTSGFIMSIMIVTLGYDFITNPNHSESGVNIFVNSFTRLATVDNSFSVGILGLFVITLLVGAIIFMSESSMICNQGIRKASLGILGIALSLGVIFNLIYAGILAAIARYVPQNQYGVLERAEKIVGLLSYYFIWIGILIFLIGFLLTDRMLSQRRFGSTLAIIATPIFLTLTSILVIMTNVRVIKADMVFKIAEPFVKTGQWQMAGLLYQRAIEFAPTEDHYYLFLGRSYLEQAKSAQSYQELDSLIIKAEADLKKAQRINPLNTDHTANLARLYNWWALQATDSDTMYTRGVIASDYFATAVTLSPNNTTIWGDWAILHIQVLDQPQKAHSLLSHAIEIDPEFSFTQGLMGDFYNMVADSTQNIPDKKAALENAVAYYQEAVRVHYKQDPILKSTYLRYLGNTYIKLAEVSEEYFPDEYHKAAIKALEEALDSDLPEEDRWQLQETLSGLFVLLGDKQTAQYYAELAMEGASGDDFKRIQTLLASIQNLP